MEAVWILLAFVLLVVAATVLVFRIEDLSRLDQGDYPCARPCPGTVSNGYWAGSGNWGNPPVA